MWIKLIKWDHKYLHFLSSLTALRPEMNLLRMRSELENMADARRTSHMFWVSKIAVAKTVGNASPAHALAMEEGAEEQPVEVRSTGRSLFVCNDLQTTMILMMKPLHSSVTSCLQTFSGQCCGLRWPGCRITVTRVRVCFSFLGGVRRNKGIILHFIENSNYLKAKGDTEIIALYDTLILKFIGLHQSANECYRSVQQHR